MLRLFVILYAFAGPTLAGLFVAAVLTMSRFDGRSMLLAVAAGFVLALPPVWFVAKRLSENG